MSTNNLQVQKHARKVYVRMHDSSRLVGAMYMGAEERLQDVMNDERSFIPIYLDDNKEHHPVVMVSKRYIQQVEEIRGNRLSSQVLSSSAEQVTTEADIREAAKVSLDGKKFELE